MLQYNLNSRSGNQLIVYGVSNKNTCLSSFFQFSRYWFPPPLLFFFLWSFFFFSFVLAWLEVFLAFLASHEALPIAVCSLSRPKSQVQHQGSIIRLVFSTVSVADFVKGLRLDLFKSISTFLQQT